MSTEAVLSASRPIDFCTVSHGGTAADEAVLIGMGSAVTAGDGARSSRRDSRAARSSGPIGLVRWSAAPRRMASMVLPAVAAAVRIATGGAWGSSRMRRSTVHAVHAGHAQIEQHRIDPLLGRSSSSAAAMPLSACRSWHGRDRRSLRRGLRAAPRRHRRSGWSPSCRAVRSGSARPGNACRSACRPATQIRPPMLR